MPPRKPKAPTAPDPSTGTASAPATTRTRARKTYESTPVPQQITFPPRRKTVKTYGGRRSLPARLDGAEGGRTTRRSMRQQTLTQIDYVRSSSGLGQEEGGLRVDDGEDDGEADEDEEMGDSATRRGGLHARALTTKGGLQQVDEGEVEVVEVTERKRPSERRSKRRKTTGDVPGLERKSSSFHTQTLTQFLGTAASKLGEEEEEDRLRVEDEDDMKDLPLPRNTPVKSSARIKGLKGEAVEPDPRTPRRIRDPYEVPSSQPSPFTPIAGHSPIMPFRSPLTQKSTNVDAPLPTVETVSKIPRTLTIQDSYSTGGFSSSAGGESPKNEETPPKTAQREPLTELPLGSIELGVGSSPAGETSSARKKRRFVEIPDSEDELESIGSTPFKTRSTQQTPLKREVVPEDFEVAADPGSAVQTPRVAVSGTPATGKSDKENETPPIKVWDEDGATASEGSPTPRLAGKSQTARKASQVSPNTASQFWTASADDIGSTKLGMGSDEALTELAVLEEPAEEQEDVASPTPAPRASQFHGSMGASNGKFREATPQLEDDETASEAEEVEEAEEADEEHVPTSILRKTTSQNVPRADNSNGKKRKSTPELITSDSSTGEAPGTPTPVVRRVHIELPPPPTAEEVYEETPRKPHKSSPLYQRHTQARSQRHTQAKSQRRPVPRSQRQTQARSQYYTQGFESQRIPLDTIRRLGPQTDRSDIVIAIDPDIVDEIITGHRDHEFRDHPLPMQAVRCWIYTTRPVAEVKYMATFGPAQKPGQIDSGTGVGNAEFNAGPTVNKFAHKLLQVYELNNPVPLADMPDNGLGDGAPQRYRYIPPAIVGQLLANLRRPLFEESDYEDDDESDVEGDVTISQELEDQLRDDIIHSTQRPSNKGRHPHFEEDDLIPASQSPVRNRSAATTTRRPDSAFARPPVSAPKRSSQRLRNQHSQPSLPKPQQRPTPFTATGGYTSTSRNTIRPSQATTASNLSSAPPSPAAEKSSYPPSTGPASVPRPRMPGSSSELSSLPGWAGLDRDGEDGEEDSLLRLPAGESGFGGLTSSQAGLLPPDSLLVEEVRMAPPPVEVWDSDDERF